MPNGRIECLYPPCIKRELPPENRAETLTQFSLWIKLHRDRPVRWFNNVEIGIGHLNKNFDVSIEDIYKRSSDDILRDFNVWLPTAPITVNISNSELACSVLGKIKRYCLPGSREVLIDIEDILISHHAYCSLVHDIKEANPDWIPFFFRGGVPPGLAATGAFFAEESDIGKPSPATTRFHWVPGLTHTENKSGCQNKDLFLKALIDKADSNPRGSKLRIFAIDTSFTGSSAPTSLISTLESESLPPAYLSKIDVTLAIILPVEQNTEIVHKENGLASDKEKAVPINLFDGDGRQAYFHRLNPKKLPINFRFYPIRKSLTEDKNDIMELKYLHPKNGKPTYGITIRENVNIRIKYQSQEILKNMSYSERADTVHDWFFNSFNPSRLKSILSALGLSPHIDKATEHILGQSKNAQYKNQGCIFPVV